MAYEININQEYGIIELEHYGRVDVEEIYKSRNELADIIRKDGPRKIIINMLNRELLSKSLDEYRFSRELTTFFPRDTKVSVIIFEDDPNYEKYRFAETVGLNTGFQLRLFHDMDKAVLWLNR